MKVKDKIDHDEGKVHHAMNISDARCKELEDELSAYIESLQGHDVKGSKIMEKLIEISNNSNELAFVSMRAWESKGELEASITNHNRIVTGTKLILLALSIMDGREIDPEMLSGLMSAGGSICGDKQEDENGDCGCKSSKKGDDETKTRGLYS